MKLALVGYGKMGRMLDELAPQYGFEVTAKIDVNDDIALAKGADVAIEFSTPEAALGNIEKLAALGVPAVIGTTGWLKEMDRVKAAVAATNTGLVWSPNFSIGVVIFTKLVREASKWMAAEQQYGAWAW